MVSVIVPNDKCASLDVFLSCCLLFGAGVANMVCRREFTKEDLEDRDKFVLGHGRAYDVKLRNCDPCVSPGMILEFVLAQLKLPKETIKLFGPVVEHCDAARIRLASMPIDNLPALLFTRHPIEGWLLNEFASTEIIPSDGVSALACSMKALGKYFFELLVSYAAQADAYHAYGETKKISNVKVFDLTAAPPEFTLEWWPNVGLYLSSIDKRDNYVIVYNVEEGHRLRMSEWSFDFSKAKGLKGVIDVAPNGSYCDVAPKHVKYVINQLMGYKRVKQTTSA